MPILLNNSSKYSIGPMISIAMCFLIGLQYKAWISFGGAHLNLIIEWLIAPIISMCYQTNGHISPGELVLKILEFTGGKNLDTLSPQQAA